MSKTTPDSYDFDKSSHAVYSLQYHLILVVKYRRKIFDNEDIIETLKNRVQHISEKRKVRIVSQETDQDHIHIIFRGDPTTDITQYINSLKTGTSRVLRNIHPEIKEKLWKDALWSRSYCLISTGEVTLDKLKKYVEEQGKQ